MLGAPARLAGAPRAPYPALCVDLSGGLFIGQNLLCELDIAFGAAGADVVSR